MTRIWTVCLIFLVGCVQPDPTIETTAPPPPTSIEEALATDLPIGYCACSGDFWCCQPPGWPEVCQINDDRCCDPRWGCWPQAPFSESGAQDTSAAAAALDAQLAARQLQIDPDMRISCSTGPDGWTECCTTTQTCSICTSCYAGVCHDTSSCN